MANIPEVSLPAEQIVSIAGMPLTNSHLATLFVSITIITIAVLLRSRLSLIPGRSQIIFEGILNYFEYQLKNAYGSEERARKHLPYILTLFLFILISNQFALFPIINSIVTADGTSVFRTPTSHYSLTITFSLMTILSCNLIAFSISPPKYIGKFIKIAPILKSRSFGQLGMALIDFFIGLLDIVGELAKIISTSARLFGNLFAGDVMILIIVSLSTYTQFILPIPFMVLGIASGIIQAFVFVLLSLNFMAGTIPAPETKEPLKNIVLR